MNLTCRCGEPIQPQDSGLCEACWKALFEEDGNPTTPYQAQPTLSNQPIHLPF